MKIDWLQVPSKFTHAHVAETNMAFVTTRPMQRVGEKLEVPDVVSIGVKDGEVVEVGLAYLTGPTFITACIDAKIEAFDVPGQTQVSRPNLAAPMWDMLPDEITEITVCPFDIQCDAAVPEAIFETIRRMNLREGRHVRHNIAALWDGECIHMAVDVMRQQRAKGLEKYGQPLETNKSFTLPQMVRMAQEEMADGAVYLAKLQMMIERLQHLADHGDIDAIRKELQG